MIEGVGTEIDRVNKGDEFSPWWRLRGGVFPDEDIELEDERTTGVGPEPKLKAGRMALVDCGGDTVGVL